MTESTEFIDLTGLRFGRLKVLYYDNTLGYKRNSWVCQCDCGKTVHVRGGNLRKGNTQSCGCLKDEVLMARNVKHGDCRTKLYDIWCAIKARCMNPHNKRYKDYGARGITIHPDWAYDYAAFKDYILGTLGEKPASNYSLDRIDNDRGYIPGNLRWATYYQQNHNRRDRKE